MTISEQEFWVRSGYRENFFQTLLPLLPREGRDPVRETIKDRMKSKYVMSIVGRCKRRSQNGRQKVLYGGNN